MQNQTHQNQIAKIKKREREIFEALEKNDFKKIIVNFSLMIAEAKRQ